MTTSARFRSDLQGAPGSNSFSAGTERTSYYYCKDDFTCVNKLNVAYQLQNPAAQDGGVSPICHTRDTMLCISVYSMDSMTMMADAFLCCGECSSLPSVGRISRFGSFTHVIDHRKMLVCVTFCILLYFPNIGPVEIIVGLPSLCQIEGPQRIRCYQCLNESQPRKVILLSSWRLHSRTEHCHGKRRAGGGWLSWATYITRSKTHRRAYQRRAFDEACTRGFEKRARLRVRLRCS